MSDFGGFDRGLHAYTLAEYLELEAFSGSQHEYLGGSIHAKVDIGTRPASIVTRVRASLRSQLAERALDVRASDRRVRVRATGLVAIPDVSVVPLPVELDGRSAALVVNPVVLVEVLTPSTEAWTRGVKLEHYATIPSLEDCLLVGHREQLVERWSRAGPARWERREARAGDVIALPSIDAELEVDRIYERAHDA